MSNYASAKKELAKFRAKIKEEDEPPKKKKQVLSTTTRVRTAYCPHCLTTGKHLRLEDKTELKCIFCDKNFKLKGRCT